MKDLTLTIAFLAVIASVFGVVHYAKNKAKKEIPVTHSQPHLTNQNKALELVIKHLKEEHNIIVPIEDVDRLEITRE
jgi:hypothetical protein